MDKNSRVVLRCPCGDHDPDATSCFFVDGHAILEPVTDFVLSQVSFPDMVNEVREYLEDDLKRSRKKDVSYKQRRQQLKEEIDNLVTFIAKSSDLKGDTLSPVKNRLEELSTELKELDRKSVEKKTEVRLGKGEINAIVSFLADIRSKWHLLPTELQTRFFKLLLSKIIIEVLPDENFHAYIHWKTGVMHTLWIECPLENMPRKLWTNEQIALLREIYPSENRKTIVAAYSGKTRDSIREQAHRLGLKQPRIDDDRWKEEEDKVLFAFANGEKTYKEMRFELLHRRSVDISRRMDHLDLEMPNVKRVMWRLVNTSQNETFSREQSGARCAPSARFPIGPDDTD